MINTTFWWRNHFDSVFYYSFSKNYFTYKKLNCLWRHQLKYTSVNSATVQWRIQKILVGGDKNFLAQNLKNSDVL